MPSTAGAATPMAKASLSPNPTPGFFLCVSRLLPYKNVDVVVRAFTERLPEERLIVVGDGPLIVRCVARRSECHATRIGNQMRAPVALQRMHAVVAASYEDYGLTPLEGAMFGRPALVLRYGGFLDTVREGVTGFSSRSPTTE